MDPVFDAQFRTMQAAMAERGVQIEVALTSRGEVDYLYRRDRLLLRDGDENLTRVDDHLRGVRPVEPSEAEPVPAGLAEVSIEGKGLTVPEALRLIEDNEDRRQVEQPGSLRVAAAPNHFLHITRVCPAGEPEVPPGEPRTPWPPVRDAGGAGVLIGVSDTGLLPVDPVRHPWLAGVTGELDPLVQIDLTGTPRIGKYGGHGTFIAGVARSVAPDAAVVVNDHMTASGGELETVFCQKLTELITGQPVPQVLSLSAGTYTFLDRELLGFVNLWEQHLSQLPDVQLVSAAGNDSQDRPFWPAAFEWCVGVGALGTDEEHRAWFSNFGDWVDVYAPGEGMINAFADGDYTYQEPPKAPARQTFTGMARWDGTSYSTPFAAGLVAARIARERETATVAASAVLAEAATYTPKIAGLDRVLRRDATP